MSEISTLNGMITSAAARQQSIAYNSITASYNASVDIMFKKLHTDNHVGEEGYEYDKNNYIRYSTRHKDDVLGLIDSLKKEDADFSVSSSKLNGLYIIEINKENSDIADGYINSTKNSLEYYNRINLDRLYREDKSNERNYVSGFLRYFPEINAAISTISRISSLENSSAAMQTVTVRADERMKVKGVLWQDEEGFVKKITAAGESIYLDEIVQTGRFANDLKESYNSAVNQHHKKVNEICDKYGFKIGDDKNIEKTFAGNENKILEEKEKYNAMILELNQLDGMSYKMKGSTVVREVSPYQTDAVSNVCRRLKEDIKMYSENPKKYGRVLNSLKNDFGLNLDLLGEKELYSIKEILMTRAADNNILLINRFGKFNRKAFTKLSKEDLLKLGISKNSQNIILEMTGKSFGRTNLYLKDLASVMKRAMFRDKDLGLLRQSVLSSLGTTKKSLKVSAKQLDIVKLHIEQHRAAKKIEREKKRAEEYLKKAAVRKKKVNSMTTGQKIRQKTAAAKDGKKFNSVLKKKEKKKYKLKIAFNKTKEKIMQSEIGKLVIGASTKYAAVGSALGYYIGIFILVYIFICIQVCIIMFSLSSITSLFGFVDSAITDALSPNDYTETCVWYLTEAMQELEDDWLSTELMDSDGAFDSRNDIRYTVKYYDLERYISSFSTLDVEDGDIVNYPFGIINTDIKVTFTDYSGENTVDIMCNASNYLSEETKNESTGTLTYAESGHTSNIKDIICMCDVMYNSTMADYTDGNLTSCLGTSPAMISYTNIKTFISNCVKFVWNGLNGIFGDTKWYDHYCEQKGEYLASYKTLLNYCTTLFEATHQSAVTLELQYYTDINLDNPSGGQTLGSALGYCCTPEVCTAKLSSFNGAVAPSTSGSVNLSTYYGSQDNKPSVLLSNAVNPDSLCILNSYKANENTISKISDNECWSHVDIESEIKISVQEYVWTSDISDEGYPDINKSEDIQNPVKEELVDKLAQKRTSANNTYINSYTYTPSFASSTKYILPNEDSDIEWMQQTITADALKLIYLSDDNSFVTEILNEINCSDAVNQNVKLEEIEIENEGEYSYIHVELTDGRYKTITLYSLTASNIGTRCVTEYTRDCKGHEFYYCGGHLCCHTTGQVYSATQEQLDLAGGMYAQMVACNNDYNENGISIVGKIADDLDNTSAERAITTGMSTHPYFDINGSFAGINGLNIMTEVCDGERKWVKNYGEEDKSNIALKEESETGYYVGSAIRIGDASTLYLMKDIFDVDTGILKGCACFPTESVSDFYGWTTDNMYMALLKMTQDWNEIYGFDIPWSIDDNYSLSQTDIDAIIDELYITYGYSFTEEREHIIRTALSQVGLGNYSTSDTHDHSYLCSTHICRTTNRQDESGETIKIDWTTSCSVGDTLDFVTFCYYTNGIIDTASDNNFIQNSPILAEDYSNVLPSDIIVHIGSDSQSDAISKFDKMKQDAMPTTLAEFKELYNRAREDTTTKYIIYIGTLDHEVTLTRQMWHKDEADTTEVLYTIPADTPIYVTLDTMSEKSRISCGSVALGGFDIMGNSKSYLYGRDTYSWILSPDTNTKVYRLSRRVN